MKRLWKRWSNDELPIVALVTVVAVLAMLAWLVVMGW